MGQYSSAQVGQYSLSQLARAEGIIGQFNETALNSAINYICEAVKSAGGYLHSLNATDFEIDENRLDGTVGGSDTESKRLPPSAFCTYWGFEALSSTVRLAATGHGDQDLEPVLKLMTIWAETALASIIAWHHAGVPARFDPVEALCAAAIIYQSPETAERFQLADHAVHVVLEDYSQGGLLTRSRAVLAAKVAGEWQSIYCSTYEALSYLLLALQRSGHRPPISNGLLGNVLAASRHMLRSWDVGRGVPNDQDWRIGGKAQPTAFSTAAGMTLLSCAEWLVEEYLDQEARSQLGVPSSPPEKPGLEPPEFLEQQFLRSIIGLVDSKSTSDRSRAIYSMIWFGPPGTGKTSYARRLASDLKWPLLEVTQKDFLVRGTDYIDACAEQIFKLLLCLKRVVILFDELEELVQARENVSTGQNGAPTPNETASRLLTTSMLPRIHELRDQAQVVFIFATNRLATFDPAATRLGRIDAIIPIPPPSLDERKKAYETFADKWWSKTPGFDMTAVQKILAEENFPEKYEGTTYKDIEFVAMQLYNIFVKYRKVDRSDIKRILASAVSIDEPTRVRFKKLVQDAARPRVEVELS